MILETYRCREDWLHGRQGRIGGSDAAATVGASPYMTNVELWEIKTGRRYQRDISQNDLVWYGTHAEDHLRELFRLDFPNYEVYYKENNLWINEKYPFAHASLDGWLKDDKGRNGILEIKTATITSAVQRAKWNNQIPQNYYCQVLWYMMVTEFDFAILKAQLKTEWPGQLPSLRTEHYLIERSDVQKDIDYLREAGERFWSYVEKDTRPPLILPEI
jgi:putative phage-type endonuclease